MCLYAWDIHGLDNGLGVVERGGVIEEHNTDGGAVASWLSGTSHWFQTTLINLYRVVFDDDAGLAAHCVDV